MAGEGNKKKVVKKTNKKTNPKSKTTAKAKTTSKSTKTTRTTKPKTATKKTKSKTATKKTKSKTATKTTKPKTTTKKTSTKKPTSKKVTKVKEVVSDIEKAEIIEDNFNDIEVTNGYIVTESRVERYKKLIAEESIKEEKPIHKRLIDEEEIDYLSDTTEEKEIINRIRLNEEPKIEEIKEEKNKKRYDKLDLVLVIGGGYC